MKKFFKNHPEFILAAVAIALSAILLVYFFWGISVLIADLNKSIGVANLNQKVTTFDLEGAKALNLKGLVK
jgi:hypothetical protein